MNIGLTDERLNSYQMTNGFSKRKTDPQDTDSFSDYFQKGNVKHLDGAKYAMSPSGDEAKNAYFRGAKDGYVEYNGVTFRCNYKTGALELGDCSHPNQCIRVPLEKGGSLLFNPDSIGGVNDAIGMFSAEDQGRIMRAIQMYNMAKEKLEELEEDKNADPEETTGLDERVDNNNAAEDHREEDVEQAEITKDYVAILRRRTEQYEVYDVMGNRPSTLPSFVGKVFTEEELQQYVDNQVKANQDKKTSLVDMLKASSREGVNASFKFAGEDKVYSFYDFIDEFEKRSGVNRK